jgi:hypothetical protein
VTLDDSTIDAEKTWARVKTISTTWHSSEKLTERPVYLDLFVRRTLSEKTNPA